ncbi:MAG: PcfJ domain-containing protein [Solirubrobacterales bacterium]
MKWSQLRKRIEDLLADSVRERVQIGSTAYGRSSDGRGWISIDGHEILVMTWTNAESWSFPRDQEGRAQFAEARDQAHAKNMFSRREWHESLFDYLSLSMEDILTSGNLLIRAIGMLDARLGKRRLRKIDIAQEHPLVQRLYCLRCDTEGLDSLPAAVRPENLTSRLKRPVYRGTYDISQERREKSIHELVHGKKSRQIGSLISAVYRNRASQEDLDTETAREIGAAFAQSDNRTFLHECLRLLESSTKLLDDGRYLRGILALIRNSPQWLRSLAEWRPRSHNPDKQFSSLARHLFAEYDVPVFMDQAWLQDNATHQEWFKHIGRGGNIRAAPGLPIPLTKKMAHHFLEAPQNYSIEAAILWGQVHALGSDRRLADALRVTRLAQDFHDNDFRLSVLRFLASNPMLDPAQIGPIIDYIWHEKYENQIVFVDRGVAEDRGPAQPNFSLRGRTIASLLRQVEAWHRQLGRESKARDTSWKHSAIHDWQFVEGTRETQTMKVWRIRELLSGRELAAEGRSQRHCVASYAQSCLAGRCSIWTMDVETEAGVEKCVTIELRNADRTVCQVRGRCNRFPTEKEKQILQRWANQEGLRIESYLA